VLFPHPGSVHARDWKSSNAEKHDIVYTGHVMKNAGFLYCVSDNAVMNARMNVKLRECYEGYNRDRGNEHVTFSHVSSRRTVINAHWQAKEGKESVESQGGEWMIHGEIVGKKSVYTMSNRDFSVPGRAVSGVQGNTMCQCTRQCRCMPTILTTTRDHRRAWLSYKRETKGTRKCWLQ
jgi:hypothetical protein